MVISSRGGNGQRYKIWIVLIAYVKVVVEHGPERADNAPGLSIKVNKSVNHLSACDIPQESP